MKESLINQVCKALDIDHAALAEKMGYTLQTIRNASHDPDKLTKPMTKHLQTLLACASFIKDNTQ